MKSQFIIWTLTLATIALSCEEFDDRAPYRVYTLREGTHGQNLRTENLVRDYLTYDVIFDETAIYETVDPVNQADINKLFGFADCSDHHHTNSARFGWRWYEGNLEIHTYTYANEVRSSQFLTNVELNKSYQYYIELYDDHYTFWIKDLTDKVSIERGNTCDKGIYYLLFPYFGGDETAPHDITIHMRKRPFYN